MAPALALGVCGLQAADEDPILRLRGLSPDLGRTNLVAIETRVRAATSDPAQSAQIELRLLSVLQSDASTEAKQFICRQLRLVGSDASAPTLGRMLTDPTLAYPARAALEAFPSFSGGATLRQALGTARGEQLVGVINSLGERREPVSVPALLPHLSSRDVAAVQATVAALGKIGGDAALEALRGVARQCDAASSSPAPANITLSEDARRRLDITGVFDAFLACAERYHKDARTDRAVEVYEAVYEAPAAPRPQQLAALTALTALTPDRATPLILKLLRAQDPRQQAFGAGLVGQLPPTAAAPLVALLETLPPTAQAGVLDALGSRPDPSFQFPLQKGTLSADPAVRAAALRALGSQEGTRENVQLLLGVAAGESGQSAVAHASLVRLRGPTVDADLLAQLDQSSVAMRAEAARCLAARGVRDALPRLARLLGDSNAPVRFAALDALGQLGGKDELPDVLDHLASAGAAVEQEAAARSVLAIARSLAATSPLEARAAAEKVLATVKTETLQAEARETLKLIDKPNPNR